MKGGGERWGKREKGECEGRERRRRRRWKRRGYPRRRRCRKVNGRAGAPGALLFSTRIPQFPHKEGQQEVVEVPFDCHQVYAYSHLPISTVLVRSPRSRYSTLPPQLTSLLSPSFRSICPKHSFPRTHLSIPHLYLRPHPPVLPTSHSPPPTPTPTPSPSLRHSPPPSPLT